MDKFVGKRLDGRYEIHEIIGVGGMAVVYKAFDNLENRTVAVKILKEEFISNEEFLRRFKNESRAIAMLSHPNIVNVYDVSFGDLIQYIVMEYIEGITLKEFIEQQGSLRWKDAVHLTIQILKGLQHAHDKGIVHRDVKPQNIMVLPDGTIKVTDFGIARFARSDQRTITDKAIGSVHYISPEQARGERTDEKSDIYSVGVMLYEMLTGKLPFQAESAVSVAIMQLQRDPQLPTEINGSIPQGLEQITMHAMQKTPQRRYQSSAEMLCDLGQFRKDPSLTFEYTYFVDNSPTKFVSSIGAVELEQEEETPEVEEKPKSNIIPILAGIAATLVISLVIIGIIVAPKLFSGTGGEIDCPDFVGKNYQTVMNDKNYKEDFLFEIKWIEDENTEYGIIVDQSVTPGEKLKKNANAKITLFVSQSGEIIKVPDVYGMTETQAISELKASKFEIEKIVEMPSEETEKGRVVKTEPQRTSSELPGTKITIYISSGAPTKEVEVSDVTTMTQDEAEKLLIGKGLKVQSEKIKLTFKDEFLPVGLVTKQSEKEGTIVPEGTIITIYVCEGYTFDVDFELPSDLTDGEYQVSLWKSGEKLKGVEELTIASKDKKKGTLKGAVTTAEELEVTVKITDKNGKSYDIAKYNVDNKEHKITKLKDSFRDYPKGNISNLPSDEEDDENFSEGENENNDSSDSSNSSSGSN